MRVIHVVRQFHPSVGGLQEMVLRLALALKDHGCQPSVVTLNRAFEDMDTVLSADDVVQGIPVRRIPFAGSRRYPLSPALLTRLKDADLVHVHAVDFAFDFLAATRPLHRKPIVASTHGGFFHTGFAPRLKKAYFQTITRASAAAYDRIYAVSRQDASIFGRIVSPQRLRLLENGADVAKFAEATAHAVPSRKMIYFGRISSPKRIGHIFPILKALRATDPAWGLVVAGREWDLGMKSLQSAATQVGVEAAVRFVASPSNAELRQLISDCGYFVSLSSFEGFGLAPVEALSAGLMPILSDIPPFRDVVERTGHGLLVDTSQPDEAAIGIRKLAERYELTHHSVKPELMRVAQGFSWSVVGASYAASYREVLQGRDGITLPHPA
jgi:alpha-1,3-mannosyltransferase